MRVPMAGLIDATALGLIDLPLVRYTIHPYGVETDAWPLYMNERLKLEKVITGWEVWCESTEMASPPDAARWQPESGTHPRNMNAAQFEEWMIDIVQRSRARRSD